MSPRMIVIFSELRSVSVGFARGFGWTARPLNVREQPTTVNAPRISAKRPFISSACLVLPSQSIATSMLSHRRTLSGGTDEPTCVIHRPGVAFHDLGEVGERVGNVVSVYHPVAPGQVDRAQHGVSTLELVVDDQVRVFRIVP